MSGCGLPRATLEALNTRPSNIAVMSRTSRLNASRSGDDDEAMQFGTSRQALRNSRAPSTGFRRARKAIKRSALIGIRKIIRQLAADHGSMVSITSLEPLAHIDAVGVVDARRHAEFGHDLGDDGIGQHLAVREDAVKVDR